MKPEAQDGVLIDLSQFILRTHVQKAVDAAYALLDESSPIDAGHALLAVSIANEEEPSPAFSRWASLLPSVNIPRLKLLSRDRSRVLVTPPFARSFEIARKFLLNKEVWGRDFITIALLAVDDPSMKEITDRAGHDLQWLQDEWFRYVSLDKGYEYHRPWAEWWKAAGVPLPKDFVAAATIEKQTSSETAVLSADKSMAAAASVTPNPTQSFTQSSGAAVMPVEAAPVSPAQSEPVREEKTETQEPQKRVPDLWMVSDRPLEDHFSEQDQFQFADYANALAAVLDHDKTETPFTMAINAPWGAGKTTLANMIAEQLRQRPKDRGHAPHIICWFNAWMHDDAPNLATAFISDVGRAANRHRHLLTRLFDPLPSALLEPRGRRWRNIFVATAALVPIVLLTFWVGIHLDHSEQRKKALTQAEAAKMEMDKASTYQVTTSITRDGRNKYISRNNSETHVEKRDNAQRQGQTDTPFKDPVDLYLEAFQSRLVVLGAFLTAFAGLIGFLVKVIPSTSLGGFVESPDKAAEAGAISSAAEQLKKLIKQATWRGNRFVVFVDDIERCKPPRSVDVLDAVNQLMSHKGVIVVFLGDMSAVAAAAQLKYKELAEIFVPSTGSAMSSSARDKEAFGRLYVQKIVQFQFDLPIPPMEKIRDYMNVLAVATQSPGGTSGRA